MPEAEFFLEYIFAYWDLWNTIKSLYVKKYGIFFLFLRGKTTQLNITENSSKLSRLAIMYHGGTPRHQAVYLIPLISIHCKTEIIFSIIKEWS